MFYAVKYHPTDLYATVEGEKISFNAEVINKIYDLPNDGEYLQHKLINNPTWCIATEVLKTIVWVGVD